MAERPNKQLVVVLGIIEHQGKFLIVRRVDALPMWHHKWELPGGKIDPGESPIDTLQREIAEETGLIIHDPELLGIHTHHWETPDHTQQTFLITYRAQTTSPVVRLQPDENDASEWVTLAELFAHADHLDGNAEMIRALYAPPV